MDEFICMLIPYLFHCQCTVIESMVLTGAAWKFGINATPVVLKNGNFLQRNGILIQKQQIH